MWNLDFFLTKYKIQEMRVEGELFREGGEGAGEGDAVHGVCSQSQHLFLRGT